MKRWIIGIASAVTAFIATKKLVEKEHEPVKSFEWIDGDGEETTDIKPEYEVGEVILPFNPYTGDYADFDFDGSPIHYEIEDIKWDAKDKVYRYKVDEGTWFAEPWMTRPKYPYMQRDLDDYDDATDITEDDEGEIVLTGKNAKQSKQILGHRAAEKTEVARRKEWIARADVLLDQHNGLIKAGNMGAAHAVMAQYKSEQAMFLAGNVIRELGGELNGERPEVMMNETDESND